MGCRRSRCCQPACIPVDPCGYGGLGGLGHPGMMGGLGQQGLLGGLGQQGLLGGLGQLGGYGQQYGGLPFGGGGGFPF